MDLTLDQLIDLVNKEDLQSLKKATEESNDDKENRNGTTTDVGTPSNRRGD